MEKYRSDNLKIVLYSVTNPWLEDIFITLPLGNLRTVSPDTSQCWLSVSYRMISQAQRRILHLVLDKKTRKFLRTCYKPGPILSHDLVPLTGRPREVLELYDSVELYGSIPQPSAPPAYMDTTQGENGLPNLYDDSSANPADTRDGEAGLLLNTFYNLSL